MNQQTLEFLHSCLVKLKDPKNQKANLGICDLVNHEMENVGLIFGPISDLLKKCMGTWHKRSGHPIYPVPAISARNPPNMAFSLAQQTHGMWVGEYGALRLELLDHCIAECEKLLKEETNV